MHDNSAGRLTLVSTPIGNLGDMPPRGLEALKSADLVLCEDTRVTAKLLNLFGFKAPLMRCDDHQEHALVDQVLEKLSRGQNLVLVSDAGTPLISDPGYRIVQGVRQAGYSLTAIPGPAAPILALILSGLPSDRFFFGGFLPNKSKARQEVFQEIKELRATLIFFENPKRLTASLQDAYQVFGANRDGATARELTKKFEEIRTGSIQELLSHYQKTDTPKGEMVVLFGPAPKQTSDLDMDTLLHSALASQSASQAAREIAKKMKLPKSQVYERALELKQSPDALK